MITTCPFCGVGCSADVTFKRGKITKVVGYEHGVNAGALCIKGKIGLDFVCSPKRIKEPMIRKDGQLVPVSWDEAIAKVAEKFSSIKETFGSDSMALIGGARCTNEDSYLMQKFARAILGTNNVDNSART